MQDLEAKIESVELKVRKLLKKAELLTKENKELIEENIQLKKELQKSKDFVNIDSAGAEISANTASNQEIRKIKEELDGYIEEVSNCINLLDV